MNLEDVIKYIQVIENKKRYNMSSLLLELGYNSIITADGVTRLKSYIARKSPDASVPKRAVILADALNKVIDSRLPEMNEVHRKRLKRVLLEHITKKPTFEIFCSDIFEAAVELKETGEDFFDGLEEWLAANLGRRLPRKQLVGLVLEAHELMLNRPDLSMTDRIAAAEAAVGEQVEAASTADRVEPGVSVFKEETSTDVITTIPEKTKHIKAKTSAGYAAARLKAISRTSAREESTEQKSVFASETTEIGWDTFRNENWTKEPQKAKPVAIVASGEYAAARLKAISRKTSSRMEPQEPDSAIRLETTSDRMAEASEPYTVPGYFSGVFAKSPAIPAFRRHPGDWRRLSAAAAAVVLIFAGLFFGAGRLMDRTANGAQYQAEAFNPTDMPYEYTVLTEEEVAAGANTAQQSTLRMKATAYDLSFESCGKRAGEPGYGITSSGSKAQVGRTVAVDPEVVPLGSRLMITFPEEYSYLDGIYLAEDTGRLIKGSSIDIFFGEDKTGSKEIYNKAMEFGVRYVDVKILEDPGKSAS